MTALPFDTLKFARQLREKAGFTREHAEATAEALAEALGASEIATKADVAALRTEMGAGFIQLEQRMTIKLGGMLIVATGVILAAMKYFPAAH